MITNNIQAFKNCVEVEKEIENKQEYIIPQFKKKNKEIVVSLHNSLIRP